MTDQNNLLVFLLNMNLLLHLLFLNINLLIGGAQLVLVRRMSSPTSKPPHTQKNLEPDRIIDHRTPDLIICRPSIFNRLWRSEQVLLNQPMEWLTTQRFDKYVSEVIVSVYLGES